MAAAAAAAAASAGAGAGAEAGAGAVAVALAGAVAVLHGVLIEGYLLNHYQKPFKEPLNLKPLNP